MTTAVMKLPPKLQKFYNDEIMRRLDIDGKPIHPGNDYERHLFARRLRILGKTREEVKVRVIELGLEDIQPRKRQSYVEDVLNSVLVGFANTEPIYV